jgi:hypothetical protein
VEAPGSQQEESNEEKKGQEEGEIPGDDTVYTEIKSGYRLIIDSWENDLDSPYKFIQEGYSKKDVKFIVDFCLLFERRQPFSNLYEPSIETVKDLAKALLELIDQHKPHSYHVLKDFGIDEELINQASEENNYKEFMEAFSVDWSPHFFSTGDSNFPYFTRVCEQIRVEYIPETIRILDVSKRFVGR